MSNRMASVLGKCMRINSVQIRNAMRSIDKRSVVTSGDHVPDLVLMERLSKRNRNGGSLDN